MGVDSRSPYSPLYARAVGTPKPWRVPALFAEHTGTHASGPDRAELNKLQEKAACKPLTPRDRPRFEQLAKQESQLQSVTKFLPTVRKLYQVTSVGSDTLEHEEIIRGAPTGSGDYKASQGNLEKALKSIP